MTLECEMTQISMGFFFFHTHTHTFTHPHTPASTLQATAASKDGNFNTHISCKSAGVAAAERVTAVHRLQFNPACYSSQVVAELLASLPPLLHPHPLLPMLHFHTKILTSLLRFRRGRLICPGANIFSSMCTL